MPLVRIDLAKGKPAADCIIIQMTSNGGRTVEQKRNFNRAIADGLHHRLNLSRKGVIADALSNLSA